MREYASMQQPALVLEGLEELPLELEQCEQRIQELEAAFNVDLEARETLLKRHVACLKVLNGEQGARFGESLVSAVSRSDRCAQEICHLRERVIKLEGLRDNHWRAAASLSLGKLNSSYLKAKEEISSQAIEIARLKQERDEAITSRVVAVTELKALRNSRSHSSMLPVSVCGTSQEATPSSSPLDLATFPVPPEFRGLPRNSMSRGTTFLRLPVPTKGLSKSLPTSPPTSQSSDGSSMANIEVLQQSSGELFCSLPTPAVSLEDLSSSMRASSPASPGSSSLSKLKVFRERVRTVSKPKIQPLAASELPWARITPPPPLYMIRTGRSQSAPGVTGAYILDPHADQFSGEMETLRFVPRKWCLSRIIERGSR